MHKIVKRISFCYGHRLMDYQGPCARPHGHTALLEVELAGELDSQGMVRDFGEVKKVLDDYIDQAFDHRMILRRDDPMVEALESAGEEVVVLDVNPTAENLSRIIFDKCRQLGLPVSAVRLWETYRAYAEYSCGGSGAAVAESGGHPA